MMGHDQGDNVNGGLSVSNGLYYAMRRNAFYYWITIVPLSIFGGLLAVGMDADHLASGWGRETHLVVVVVGGLLCFFTVAFVVRRLWFGLVRN
jgi:hypothetical protein